MKTNRIQRWLMAGCAVALFAAIATTSTQAGSHGPRRGWGPGGGTNRILNLTTAQQLALQTAHSNIVAQSQTLLTQLQAAHTALHDAVIADTPKPADILAVAKTIGDLEGSLAVIRATELAKIHPLFTADQWTQLNAHGLFHRDVVHGTTNSPPPPVPGTN